LTRQIRTKTLEINKSGPTDVLVDLKWL
jgi:hypothetical protein